jgi:hypothetical protein
VFFGSYFFTSYFFTSYFLLRTSYFRDGQLSKVLVLLTYVVACAACDSRFAEPIPEIPANQQRTVNRSSLSWQWPFTVGAGTLGCTSGAVVFRAGGVDYALNDVARSRGFASIDPVRRLASAGPPSDPLKRLPQNRRQEIFREAARCEDSIDGDAVAACKQRLRATNQLSDSELKQIEVEGDERLWPPRARQPVSLDPLVDAGLKLCAH